MRVNGISGGGRPAAGVSRSTLPSGHGLTPGRVTPPPFSLGAGSNLALHQIQSNCLVVNTQSLGKILVGSPPEIVKRFLPDFFAGNRDALPTTLLLTKDLVKGGNIQVEPEFPVYANKYLANRKLRIVGTPEQIEAVRVILNESIFGPRDLVSAEERQELDFFIKKRQDGSSETLEDFAEFIGIKEHEEAQIERVRIQNFGQGVFRITEDEDVLGVVDTSQFCPPPEPLEASDEKPFRPPLFGLTFVGTSNGFDPDNRTTSMILWAGREGIFIDPLAEPGVELNRLGIESKDVPYVLLTHTHGDHDAGVLKRVINGQRVALIASRATYLSFLRKAKAFTGIDLGHLIDFVEAKPGGTLEINGLKLKFSRAFHSNPTMRFIAEYREEKPDDQETVRSLAYSADTYFDPDKLKELNEQGVLSATRLQELLDFVLKCPANCLIHETGIPPIHTPDKVLAQLPEEVRKRLILVHTGKLSEGVNLTLARAGQTIEVIPSKESELERIEAFTDNPILGQLPVALVAQLARKARLVTFKPGDQIVHKEETGEKFYLVVDGRLKVVVNGIDAVLRKGCYFGEAALLTGQPRNATIEAISPGRVLVIEREDFEAMLKEVPELAKTLNRVLKVRPVLSQVVFLKELPSEVLTGLSARFRAQKFANGTRIISQGDQPKGMYLVKKGEVTITVQDEHGQHLVAKLGPGQIFGEIALVKGVPCSANVDVSSAEDAEVLVLSRKAFEKLSRDIPKFTFSLQEMADRRLAEIQEIEAAGRPR